MNSEGQFTRAARETGKKALSSQAWFLKHHGG